ncbi:MAG: hypothetical protein K940chlam2_01520 [Chlamydiae bacterium]|nr:hypothetical protein [Chlamydiota bacterium]
MQQSLADTAIIEQGPLSKEVIVINLIILVKPGLYCVSHRVRALGYPSSLTRFVDTLFEKLAPSLVDTIFGTTSKQPALQFNLAPLIVS